MGSENSRPSNADTDQGGPIRQRGDEPASLPPDADRAMGSGHFGPINASGTATGVGAGSGGDARGGPMSGPPGNPGGPARGMGGTGGPGPAADVTASGGPATPAPAAGGAEGSGGTGIGGSEDGTTGVVGMGGGAMGHPAGATGGATAQDAPGREVPISAEDRARGVVEQRKVSAAGTAAAAREASVLNTGGGPSGQLGASGSGSTTNVPGGVPGLPDNGGTIGGTPGVGVGGPTPVDSPLGEARVGDVGVRGAGVRDDKTEQDKRDTATSEGRAMETHHKNRF